MAIEALMALATEIALAEGIDDVLFLRLISQESGWQPTANADAPFPSCVGLCQLNERYGRWLLERHGGGIVEGRETATDIRDATWTDARVRETLLDPEVNLTVGARELARLLRYRKLGDWHTALASWNWGVGNVLWLMAVHPGDWMARLPAETKYLLARVLLWDGIEQYVRLAN